MSTTTLTTKFTDYKVADIKLAAIANLKKHAVPMAFAHTVNLDEQRDEKRLRRIMRSLIEFTMKDRFVSGVTFTGLTALGGSRSIRPEEVFSVDRLMDQLLASCPVAIERNHVYLTQQTAFFVARSDIRRAMARFSAPSRTQHVFNTTKSAKSPSAAGARRQPRWVRRPSINSQSCSFI